jgi:hypothetical protein
MASQRRTQRFTREQQTEIEAIMAEHNISQAESVRALMDLGIASKAGNVTRAEGFLAGWREAKFQAAGMVKRALEEVFARFQQPGSEEPKRSPRRQS